MADLTKKQIDEMKKVFEQEAKKSAAAKATVADAIKKTQALDAAAKKMKTELSKEAD